MTQSILQCFSFPDQIYEACFSSHEELVSSSKIRNKVFFLIKVFDDGKEEQEQAQTQNPKLIN
jgi:hypothetical protein